MNIELAGTLLGSSDGELHQGCRSTACRSNNRQRSGARLSNSLGVGSARQQVALAAGHRAVLTVGSEVSL